MAFGVLIEVDWRVNMGSGTSLDSIDLGVTLFIYVGKRLWLWLWLFACIEHLADPGW